MAEPRNRKPDLAALSLAELRELQGEIGTLIIAKEKAEKAALAAEIENLAKERGFAVADILPLFPGLAPAHAPEKQKAKTTKGRGTVPAKYRNPADEAQTWSGRGRQPVWLQAHLAGGGKLEDVSIPAAAE